jgi:hypothetical protein
MKEQNDVGPDRNLLSRFRSGCLIWNWLLVALVIAWWSQPYFGYRFCLFSGLKHESEFVEQRRALALRRVVHGKEDLVNLAFDQLQKCVSERGLKFCHYVGPDENGPVGGASKARHIPRENRDLYRYVLKGSPVGLSLRHKDIDGEYRMNIYEYESAKDFHMGVLKSRFYIDWKNTIASGTISGPGCFANESYLKG